MEIPFLAWGGLVLHLPGEALGYLAALLSALLVGMLALRPSLFAILGLWLLGIAGSAATNRRGGIKASRRVQPKSLEAAWENRSRAVSNSESRRSGGTTRTSIARRPTS